MQTLKQHIIFKLATVVIVLTLMLPAMVKVMHVFENHQHEICYGEANTHIHTLEIDCEFYNFNVNNPFTLTEYTFTLLFLPETIDGITSGYLFLSEYQQHHFKRRGPPINLI